MLSIIIPAFNEEARIGKTLVQLKKTFRQRHEVVVVCEGNDKTAQIAKSLGARVFHFSNRLGKGKAMRIGISKAKGREIVPYDADAATPAYEIRVLLNSLKNADVAIGTRYSKKSNTDITPLRLFTAKLFNSITRLLFGLTLSDTQCGFKSMRRKTALYLSKNAKTDGFVWDVEMLYRAKGLRVREVPITWSEIPGGTISGNGVRSALKMLGELIKLRLSL